MEAERNGEFLFKGTHHAGMLEQGCPNFYHRGSQTVEGCERRSVQLNTQLGTFNRDFKGRHWRQKSFCLTIFKSWANLHSEH